MRRLFNPATEIVRWGREGSEVLTIVTLAKYDAIFNFVKEVKEKVYMAMYNVKLNMSEEYRIEADNPYEAEALARGKFGNDYLIDEVIIKEEKKKAI